MKRRMLPLLWGALIALLAAGPMSAQTIDLKRIEAVADSVAYAHIATDGTPGMTVAVAKNGKIVFSRGYGLADVEMGVAASPETVYPILSVTKQFTAAIIMQLVEAGEILLEDPITQYLPDYPTQGHHVTVRHLLNHTSGIKNFTDLDEENWQRFRLDLSYEEMIGLFGKQPFDFAPGEKYKYNNSGYYLLGEIIGRVSGMPYADYVERELLKPLGLDRTKYCDARRVIPNRAEMYEFEDGKLFNASYISMRVAGAAGALCSTARDLIRWTDLLHGGQVVSSRSLRQMTTPTVTSTGDTIGIGYGHFLDELGGHREIFHGGGSRAYLAHYPEGGFTVTVLMNGGNGRAELVEKALSRTALFRDLPLGVEERARYEGAYAIQAGDGTLDLCVFSENGKLKAQATAPRPSRLLYQGDHVFISAEDVDIRLVFAVENGRATNATLHMGDRVMQGKRKP